jgi:prepilin-type N-terminal cleavage/methylation domain-containing protein
MKKSKKGFTLFEILAVVAILAVLGVSSILTFNKVIKDTNNEKYNSIKEEIISIAKVYIETDKDLVEEVKSSGSLRVTVGELQEKKLLNWNIKNPITKENIPSSDYVYVYTSSDNGIVYEYVPVDYDYKIYGVEFNLNTGVYTRTDDAVGMTFSDPTANNEITSDFDKAEIYKEMVEVTDSYGNKFIKIPKFYIKKTVNADNTIWKYQISKSKQDSSYYLPACFMDEDTNTEIPYILVGKYNASLSNDGTKLESKTVKAPLIGISIIQYRALATANGSGYQLLDIHTIDVLQTLFYIEYATLDSTSIMYGFGAGQYSATHTINGVNGTTVTLPAGMAANYKVGQMIDIGTSLGGRQIATNLRITAVSGDTITYQIIPGVSTTPGTIATTQIVYNVSYLTGLTDTVTTKSGSPTDNTSGKYSMKYRGIENLYANLWQFVDGINIKDRVAYVAKNAKNYASDVFTGAYTQVGYTNANTDNYVTKMGYDTNNPFIQLPTEVGTIANSGYKDYCYQNVGNTIAIMGGAWASGITSGVSFWNLFDTSPVISLYFGSRLVKTP